MIRLEGTPDYKVSTRKKWVVLHIGADRYLLTPTEATDLADGLVDHAERVQQ